MPYLPLEPFLSPNDLFDNPQTPNDTGRRWWALYTRPRAEKSLARKLLARDVSFFLPLYKRQHRSSGRTYKGYSPLFSGYLFLFGDDQDRIRALETNLVSRTIFAENQPQIESDLAQVYRLMDSGFALAPEERLQPGTQVEIVSGPLAGTSGKILRRGNKTLYSVEVKFLQCAVSAEVEGWMIQPRPEKQCSSV